ncbi:MAG: SDR family NAD(P)-dependent oxidoreductase [Candidatus Hermodarchaeota archaeon]
MNNQKNFMNWENPGVALITGASSGIGAAYTRSLSSQGFETILVARRRERLKNLARQLEEKTSKKSEILVADLSKLEDIIRVSKKIQSLNNIDVLINNAGFGTREYFENIPAIIHKNMLFVHNLAPVYFCRAVLPSMIKRNRGVIINVSSIAAFTPRPRHVMYSSTKEFLKIFSETLQTEMHDTDIRIQSLCPGFTRTEFHYVGYYKDYDVNKIPKELWMSAEEVIDFSLNAFQDEKVVVIPGEENQKFIELYTDPRLGKKIRENWIKRSRIPRK